MVARLGLEWLLAPVKPCIPTSFVIVTRTEDYFDQMDSEDNLFSFKALFDFIQINSGSEKPVQMGTDIELFTCVNGTRFNMVSSQEVKADELKELLKSFNAEIKNPQEFSASLRKLMCLADEHFQVVTNSKIQCLSKSKYNYKAINPVFFLQLEGSLSLNN